MIVVFDTNIWLSELGLTSSAGSAVRFYLRKQNARIGLPEVVKLETEVHLRENLTKNIDEIKKNHRQLLSVFGKIKEIILPTAEEVETLIPQVFSNLQVKIENFPFTFDSARASLIRTIKKIPPSNKNQQFKDGVLWENCLEMLKMDDVCLVSNDKAFYKLRNYDEGLADELKQDIEKCSKKFKIFPRLASLLSEIKTEVQIEPEILIEAYINQNSEQMNVMVSKESFAMEGEPKTKLKIFATEDPTILYFDFTIEFPCIDISNEGRKGALIFVSGEGKYNAEEKAIIKLTTLGETLSHQLLDGTEKKLQNIVCGVMNGFIGHRTVEHSVKHKL